MNGGGTDDQVGAPYIFSPVADGHGNTQGAEVFHGSAVAHVGARDLDTRLVEHLGQRRHGNAADADQVSLAARRQIVVNVGIGHGVYTPFSTDYNDKSSTLYYNPL